MMMDVSLRGSFRVWWRSWVVFRRLWIAETGPLFAEPLVVLSGMGVGLGAYVAIRGVDSYLAFLAPGIIGGYGLFGAAFECTYGSFLRMEVRRIYQAIIATPVSIEDVITGEMLWGATRTFMSTVVIMLVIAVFGFVDSPWGALVLPASLLAGVMFASLTMVFTSLAPSLMTFNYYFSLFVFPMFVLSGTFFPLDRYPDGARALIWALPLTPYVRVVRDLLTGAVSLTTLWATLYMVVLLAVTYVLAVRLMRRRLIK